MAVYTYDPKNIAVTIGGVPMFGFADGTFLKVERDEDSYAKVNGADGHVSRAKSNNRGGSVTLTLAQTSPCNDILSGFALGDELANSGVIPVIVKDVLGTTAVFSEASWVKKLPMSEESKEVGEREWVLDCASIDIFVGGNFPQG